MIREVHGDILTADAEALVNPVNTKGVMGAGLALQFRGAYPEMYREYLVRCLLKNFQPGEIWAYSTGSNPRWIVCLATKRHWRHPSQLEWVDSGLTDLRQWVSDMDCRLLTMPHTLALEEVSGVSSPA